MEALKHRPTTQGCSEQSCMYHGGDNRFKAAHDRSCPIFQYNGSVLGLVDKLSEGQDDVRCNCSQEAWR